MAVTNRDNSNELQAALDYCSNVRLKPGTYSIGHPIVMDKEDQTITGSMALHSEALTEITDPISWIYGTQKGP